MAWIYLLIASCCEVVWAIGLKYTAGFTQVIPSVVVVGAMIVSVVLLGLAVRDIPIGTGYAVWTGIGVVGAAILGIVLFGDSASPLRLVSIGLILAGAAGLKLFS